MFLLGSGVVIRGTALPEDAPILISEAGSTRALTVLPLAGANPRIIQPGRRQVVTFYLANLDLLPGEGGNAFRVELEDSRHYRIPLQIAGFEPVAEYKGVYALSVRLGGDVGRIGDALLRVTWRGMSSNRVRVSVGYEGGKLDNDPDSYPTPISGVTPEPNRAPQSRVLLPYAGDTVRFMEQATFGPNATLEYRIRRIGFSAWLEEQMDEGNFLSYTYPEYPFQQQTPGSTCDGDPQPVDVPATCFRDNYTMYPLQNWFFKEALYNENQQLRRRVSWTLGQIMVTSGRSITQPSRMMPYVQVLDRNAFGNFRTLMKEMTLNPAMGQYLDMAISTQANPNENYAREILQLFSVGVDLLNPDGTPVLDGMGNHVPTYDQNTIVNFAKIFTGWSYCNVGCDHSQSGFLNYRDPMVVNAGLHDTTSKTLFNYAGATPNISAGQTPDQDLNAALDNIFFHPNVPPFISKLLIQQLVTSNPTPAYVARVSAVFANDGAGNRGNLHAVIRAILLDPEARGNLKTDPDYGKLREPVLYATNVLRPFSPTANNNISVPAACNGLSDGVLNDSTQPLNQDVYNSPTVFNYFPMTYVIPGTPLSGPEFSIFSTGTSLKRPNFINQMAPPNSTGATGIVAVTGAATNFPCGTRIDLTRLQNLATADTTGASLLDTLDREMMHGSLNPTVRSQFLTAIQAVSSANPLKRARTAYYLIATANQYQVQR
jgi:uncharacterized protein (DUF1800 family)